MVEPRIILASASPRRAQLLTQLGVAHEVSAVDIDERRGDGEPIEACVLRLAEQKALQVRASRPLADLPILGADTAVVLNEQMLGKPRDAQHGIAMLEQLAGRTHQVLSAVALLDRRGVRSCLSRSRVRLRPLSRAEAEQYWRSGEPCDKAGGYAIQGVGAVFVEELQGSYSGVMGLPLFETALLLSEAGVPIGPFGRVGD